MSKELVEAIEQLGNQLGITVDLAQNIYNTIKKKDNIHSYNMDIITILRNLREADERYTYFHTYYLGKVSNKN